MATAPDLAMTREVQHAASKRPYGVLGRKLGHSYTPSIYRMLADLDYVRFEREPDQLESFIRGDEWEGVNVTIPYKRSVLPYLDELSDIAERLGNVNTITRLPDGRLRGDNTDYFGFRYLVESLQIDVAGATALVLGGSGGAGATAITVLKDLGVTPIGVGRTGTVTYDDLPRYADADLLVNCTPVGMYPNCPDAPCPLEGFLDLRAVIDIVYNPARTGLMLEAQRHGIPCAGGLAMLVAQAAQACERYLGTPVDPHAIERVTSTIRSQEENIALIGMPGSGKSHIGRALAQLLSKPFIDIDDELENRLGMPCSNYISAYGEDAFRTQETACLHDITRNSGRIISCGGGVVERQENYDLLHQNSRIVMLDRPITELSKKGRPITARDGIESIAARRLPRYKAWADLVAPVLSAPDETARSIIAKF